MCSEEETLKAYMEMEEPSIQKSPPPTPKALSKFMNTKPSPFPFRTNNISDSNSFLGVSSNTTKQFSFFDFTDKISPRVDPSTFLFGSSTFRKKVCTTCNKRVGLTGFNCRCGNLFCGEHRYPEKHACSFDYKAFGREKLRKQNQVCKGDSGKLKHRI